MHAPEHRFTFSETPVLPVQAVPHPAFTGKGIALSVLRLDATHPYISGNKWFKLKGNLQAAAAEGHTRLITFGGAYSNHLVAFAAACALTGLEGIALVRGEEHLPLNPVLAFARQCGLHITYLTRSEYRHYRLPENKEALSQHLNLQYGHHFLIPEGGSNLFAAEACRHILTLQQKTAHTCIALACGTGGTLAGIVAGQQGIAGAAQVLGIAALKGGEFLKNDAEQLLMHMPGYVAAGPGAPPWQVHTDFHFGGYGKVPPELTTLINTFKADYNLPLEGIYTAKLFAALIALAQADYFAPGSRILALHTGGLFNFSVPLGV